MLFLCPVLASAQDVIVRKADGTIAGGIAEEAQTVKNYRLPAALQGDGDLVGPSEVASACDEKGLRQDFSDGAAERGLSLRAYSPQDIDDDTLLRMVGKAEGQLKKRKRIVAGVLLLAIGAPCVALGATKREFNTVARDVALGIGVVSVAGGTYFLVKAFQSDKRAPYVVQSVPLWQADFKFKNKSVLNTGVCSIIDRQLRSNTLGFGINYNF